MNKLLLGFIMIISNSLFSQEILKTVFYNIKVPEKTTIKAFASTHEELANIDSYQFISNEKPKYILYLMSNKTNVETSINTENYKDFLFDLGDLNILNLESLNGKIKINFNYVDKENIKGIIYLSINNNILNRFIFLLPNDKAKEYFQKEIDDMINSLSEIKSSW